MENILLRTHNISKKYNRKDVLKNITLSVERGESIAFVGANGCGKSTILRILARLIKPSGGTLAETAGLKSAFIPDHFEKSGLSIKQFMKYILQAEGRMDLECKLQDYYDIYHLHSMVDTPMKYLSKGSLQKIAVIQALLFDTDLLFMDEPLSGQDMTSKLHFIEQLSEKKSKGTSIMMACHEKELVEEAADTIYLIEDGCLEDGSDYFMNFGKSYGSFLLHGEDWSLIENLHSKNFFTAMNIVGKKCRLTLPLEKSSEFMTICIQKNIHILKYEEENEL